MLLTATQQIRKVSKEQYSILLELCGYSNNLYNVALYNIRQSFFKTGKPISYKENCKLAKLNENYKELQAGIAQQTVKRAHDDFSSFRELVKKQKREKTKNKIRMPHYKEKGGISQLIIRDNSPIKDGVLTLPKSRLCNKKYPDFEMKIAIPEIMKGRDIHQIRITPKQKGLYFQIEYVYESSSDLEKQEEYEQNQQQLKEDSMIGIDLGLNNLATCVSNNGASMIIDGKKIKAINQYYNKVKASCYSKLNKVGLKYSKKTGYLHRKRNNRINDYLSKAVQKIIQFAIENRAKTIVLGYNKGWKNGINIGKRNNQSFVSVPFFLLKRKLGYLAELNGIELIETEESYTSKCSFFDNEPLQKHEQYCGKRVKRGLFKTALGYLFNADVNGALNIMRKVKPEDQSLIDLRNRGFMTNPKRIIIV